MINLDNDIFNLPIMALRGMCVFPGETFNVDAIRRKSYEAMEMASENDGYVVMLTQIDVAEEAVRVENLYGTGVIAKINKVTRIPGNIARINAKGLVRVRVNSIDCVEPCLSGEVERLDDITEDDELLYDGLKRAIQEQLLRYMKLNPAYLGSDSVEYLKNGKAGKMIDTIAASLNVNYRDKQILLETLNVYKRGLALISLLNKENSVLAIKNEISRKVKTNIDREQRRFYLREQLKVINEELGDDGINGEISEYKERLGKLNLPPYALEKLEKELDRLKRIPMGAQEGSVARDYIDTVLSLPWGNYTKENSSLTKAKKVLDDDHYGLERVKERIIEFLAVKIAGSDGNGSILCLVGPPGVGKTSIARSIADALNRKYVRLSLGGVHDEAEIRGHRKTYIGAMPGRIISAIKQAGTSNPLILLDEIDKLASDYKGDPSSAFLEVLDSEQNHSFRDNYLDMPYDLSKVLFICTANSLDTIAPPLRDRMDIIQLSGYTTEEKLAIAKKHLYPKQLKKHSLAKTDLKIRDKALLALIQSYTGEAGVRQAERYIEKLCRIAVKEKLIGGGSLTVTDKNLSEYLGKPKYKGDRLNKNDLIGVCRGLAWTAIGGTTLEVEVNTYHGKGELKITGNVGKVMEESSITAMSYVKANADRLGIKQDFSKLDVHIHIPEGATPKDGPSAGVTMVTALVSALTDVPIRRDVAMTGEVDIRGRVMPIGGLKEKVLAAKRIGVKTIVIPQDNEDDLLELEQYAREGIDFVMTDNIDKVLSTALAADREVTK